MPNLRIFGLEFENIIVMTQITVLEFVLLQSFVQRLKFQNLDQQCLILVFLGWNLKTILPYLKSAPSNLSDCKNFTKKQKCLNLGPKMCNSGIFGPEFKKNIVIFEISTLEFV